MIKRFNTDKHRVLFLLVIAEVAVMSLWFVSAAIAADMNAEKPLSTTVNALLSSAVQAGFVVGALFVAISGVADRYDPRAVFALSALMAAGFNLGLLFFSIGSPGAIVMRGLTGACMAGVYPVGMKIAMGWGQRDRGLLAGLLVGGLTLGSAAPHLLSLLGGADWRLTVLCASAAALLAAALIGFTATGPHHATAARFNPSVLKIAWTDLRIRRAFGGYLGHMWELYIFWAWLGLALHVAFAQSMPTEAALHYAKLIAFVSIGAGALSCIVAGWLADRIGKAELAMLCLLISGSCALIFALSFNAPLWLISAISVIWGMSVIADSAQFSAMVADYVPAEQAGTLMALQTALGFALTIISVQAAPWVAASIGWPLLMGSLAIGPIFAICCLNDLRRGQSLAPKSL